MAITEVIPYLYYDDADAALDWLERVLGFGPSTRWTMGRPTTREADIVAGTGRISVSGRAPGTFEGGGALLVVHVDDIDTQYSRGECRFRSRRRSTREATIRALDLHRDGPVGLSVELLAGRSRPSRRQSHRG